LEESVKQLSNLFKRVRLRQILSVFFVGFALFFTSACNSGNAVGARPENPPVQLGGANNPHKGDGDGYTNYKMSTDPSVGGKSSTKRDRADLQVISPQLIAANSDQLLYPGSGGNNSQNREITPGSAKVLQAPQIPAQPQPILKRSEPDADILERVGDTFKDASAFIKDKADEASARPEAKRNPALEK
jgi:hypothetical protein